MEAVWLEPEPFGWQEVAARALSEDIGTGDLSAAAFEEGVTVDWYIEAQAEGVLCGVGVAAWILDVDRAAARDGDAVGRESTILSGKSATSFALSRERTALNFLMHLSGIASLTARFVAAVEGLPVRIVDTRKTIPGLRSLAKYAVRCGGGTNHRMGLYDGIMIKDNHIAGAGGIGQAIERARRSAPHMAKIEVECEREDQVAEAIAAGADIVMLDNMEVDEMRRIVERNRGRCVFEASGGVSLETVREIAATGVDLISVGALTHSAPALAFHMEIR
jgi:nicotinate-nucleotide pyrophosphorylase (carboxylating)